MLVAALAVAALVVVGACAQFALVVRHVDPSVSTTGEWLRAVLLVGAVQFFLGAIGYDLAVSPDGVSVTMGVVLLVGGAWFAIDPSEETGNPRQIEMITPTGRARLNRLTGVLAVTMVLLAAGVWHIVTG